MSKTSATTRGARVVAVCVTGRPCARVQYNPIRYELLAHIVREIRRRRWANLDAVLFPAGFLRSDDWLGPLPSWAREQLLDETDLGSVCRFAARRLSWSSPGCHIVVGIDSRKPNWGFRGDQMLVAFDEFGVTASARKIFPSDGDTHGWGRAPLLLFDHDPDDPRRILPLASGRKALLSVCYDAFALAELQIGPTPKRRSLRYVSDESDCWRDFKPGEADDYLGRFDELLLDAKPDLNLVAIHGFELPGRELRWQRHGIATASAALNGALTIAGTHYTWDLPAEIQSQPLASEHVPRSHLRLGPHRLAQTRAPDAGFYVQTPGHHLNAVVRLFVAR